MRFSNFPSIVLAISSLILSVSAWCKDKTVNTASYCMTYSGPYQVYNIPTGYKTISTKTSITITVTPPPITTYVREPNKTITKCVTTTLTLTKDNCRTKTVYAYTWVTSTYTISKVKTKTTSITVATVTASKYKPPHYGDDKHDYDKRGDYNKQYPTSVKCTKTIATTFTCTITASTPTVTVKIPGYTVTATNTKTATYLVDCPKVTTTITITHTQTTATKVKTTTTVTKSITVTVTPTHDPCAPHNIYRGPKGNVKADTFRWDTQVYAKNAYDCCKACYKHVNYAGVHDCAGSYFVVDKKTYKGKCWLKLTDKCYKDYKQKCYDGSKSYGYEGCVSNGPCGSWEYKS